MSDDEIEKACAHFWPSVENRSYEGFVAFVREQVVKETARLRAHLCEPDGKTYDRIAALEVALSAADKLRHLTLGGRYHWQEYDTARARTLSPTSDPKAVKE